MSTFIHGIAASENIDSSGERISISGMDISSLAVDGCLTYEHEAATGPKGEKITIKMPEQTVGKVLHAKKIFSEKDCEDEHQLYFWNKCKTPYIYAMGELFDDYTDAARDLAGKLRYDADRKHQNERTVVNFSIEGAYIAKEGIEVTRSVARKITLTSLPCNKAAIAELVPAERKGKKDLNSLFKTESVEIELFKSEPKNFAIAKPTGDLQKHADALGIEPMNKSAFQLKKPLAGSSSTATKQAPAAAPATTPGTAATPKLPGAAKNSGAHLGNTKSGKAITSHAKIHEYHGFSSQDHQDAANLHHEAASKATKSDVGRHHIDKMKLHLQAAQHAERKEDRLARGKRQPFSPVAALNNFRKSETAGSGMVAPSQLTGTAALAKEDLKGSWLKRAEDEYKSWPKREEFRAFMKKRLPHLADGEIDAIGRTLALKKSVDAETNLNKLLLMNKAERRNDDDYFHSSKHPSGHGNVTKLKQTPIASKQSTHKVHFRQINEDGNQTDYHLISEHNSEKDAIKSMKSSIAGPCPCGDCKKSSDSETDSSKLLKKSEELEKAEKRKSLPKQATGYSTVGEWKPLHVMKNLERERGNKWTVPKEIDHKTHEGIWVAHEPKDALIYNHSSELRDIPSHINLPKDHELHAEHEEFKRKLKNPADHLTSVNLAGATPHIHDGDGGYLYVRPMNKLKKSEESLEKGEKGDWQKEGYKISHVETGGQSAIGTMRLGIIKN